MLLSKFYRNTLVFQLPWSPNSPPTVSNDSDHLLRQPHGCQTFVTFYVHICPCTLLVGEAAFSSSPSPLFLLIFISPAEHCAIFGLDTTQKDPSREISELEFCPNCCLSKYWQELEEERPRWRTERHAAGSSSGNETNSLVRASLTALWGERYNRLNEVTKDSYASSARA